jgi:simple sugar transport system substrate-binding protein
MKLTKRTSRSSAGGLFLRMVVLLAVLGLLAAACGGGGTTPKASGTPQKKITIALVLNDLTNPVSLPLRKGAEDMAKKFGFTLKIVGPTPSTAQQQIALLEDLTAQKVSAIVLLPVDSDALVPEIDKVIAAGIPVVTTELDAPNSKRTFFYFGGKFPLEQGKLSADKVFEYYTSKSATGEIDFVVTSCLPTVTGQQDRRKGFEDEVAVKNSGSPFTLKEIGFFDTSTDPAKNLGNVQNIYTAKGKDMELAYAMCGPDTQNWGTVLKQNNNHNIVVAGYDFLPNTLDLIEQGWVAWAQGSSLYSDGVFTMTKLYEHFANGAALPTGSIQGDAVFATLANIQEIRNSPDVTAAQG